ncbi:MAG: GC-type dockerin domain-anchored protein, partial [bacterium]
SLAAPPGPGQSVGPDGQYTAAHIIVNLNGFDASHPRADGSAPGQSPRVDQQLTADDIIVFLNAFFAGA